MGNAFSGRTVRLVFYWVMFGLYTFCGLMDLFMPIAGSGNIWDHFSRYWGNTGIALFALIMILVFVAAAVFALLGALKPFDRTFCLLSFILGCCCAGTVLILMIVIAACRWSMGFGTILSFLFGVAGCVLSVLLFVGRQGMGSTYGGVRSIGTVTVMIDGLSQLTYEIHSGRDMVLGRDANCDIVMTYSGVDSKHCKIRYDRERGSYLIYDGSRNGCYYSNNTRLPSRQAVRVSSGKMIFIGPTHRAFIKLG